MVRYATLLLVLQLLGEVLAMGLHLPIPGPVIGMALLFGILVLRGETPEGLETTADGLLRNLSLLFVPAGVGVMLHLSLIEREWLPISVSIVAGTVIAIALTASFIAFLERRAGDEGDEP